MKLISWNVNGLRACLGKGFPEFVSKELPNLLALQEVKMEEGQAELPLPPGYHVYWNSAERKGYSGTAVLARTEPLSVSRGMGVERHIRTWNSCWSTPATAAVSAAEEEAGESRSPK